MENSRNVTTNQEDNALSSARRDIQDLDQESVLACHKERGPDMPQRAREQLGTPLTHTKSCLSGAQSSVKRVYDGRGITMFINTPPTLSLHVLLYITYYILRLSFLIFLSENSEHFNPFSLKLCYSSKNIIAIGLYFWTTRNHLTHALPLLVVQKRMVTGSMCNRLLYFLTK